MTVRLLVPAYGKQTNALYTGTTAAERALIDAGQADENLAASFDYPAYLAGKSMAPAVAFTQPAVDAATAAGVVFADGVARVARVAPPASAVDSQTYNQIPIAKPMIWDTDWWTDVDDVGAARILAWAERVGLVDVRAVGLDANWLYSPGSLDAVLRNDGRPDAVMCKPKTAHVPDGAPVYQRNVSINYPNRSLVNANLPDAVTVYRTVLAQATRSVDIVCVGYLTNIHELLNSPADAISPLTGAQLVAAKVGTLWVMGGAYPSSAAAGPGSAGGSGGAAENNFARTAQSIAAAINVAANWPTPITWMGYEVGVTVVSGQHLGFSSSTDIVANAYNLNGASGGRPSWDPMMTLLACTGDPTLAGYTTVSGKNVVAAGGVNTFTAGAGNHRYVVKAKADGWYANQLNDLMLLTTQPAPPSAARVLQDGFWQALALSNRKLGMAQPSAFANRTTATADVENLLFQVHASDCAEVGDAGSVSIIPNRAGRIGFRLPAPNGGMATYVANKGGKTALNFAANNFYLTEAFRQSLYMTVYARVWFDTLPTANQTLLSCDSNSGNGTRQFHAKVIPGGIQQIVAFSQTGTASTDNGPASVVTGAWVDLVYRLRESDIEALFGATGASGATARGASVCANTGILVLGRSGITSEQFVGFLHELRVYQSWHSDAQIGLVIADMD